MKVKDYDLYSNGFVEVFSDGEKYLERETIEYEGNETDRSYKVKENDTLTKIAGNKYKEELELAHQYWWILSDANDIENPLDLSEYIGEYILIPDPFLFLLKA